MKRKLLILISIVIWIALMINIPLFGSEITSKLPPCCQDSVKKKNNSPSKNETYQKLLITRASIESGKIFIMGETDLPAGAKVIIIIIDGKAGIKPTSIKEKIVEINNSRFTLTLNLPFLSDPQNLIAEVIFDPKPQTASVSKKISNSGVNLIGDSVELRTGRNILKTSQSIVIE